MRSTLPSSNVSLALGRKPRIMIDFGTNKFVFFFVCAFCSRHRLRLVSTFAKRQRINRNSQGCIRLYDPTKYLLVRDTMIHNNLKTIWFMRQRQTEFYAPSYEHRTYVSIMLFMKQQQNNNYCCVVFFDFVYKILNWRQSSHIRECTRHHCRKSLIDVYRTFSCIINATATNIAQNVDRMMG